MDSNQETTIWIVEYGAKRAFYTVRKNAEMKIMQENINNMKYGQRRVKMYELTGILKEV